MNRLYLFHPLLVGTLALLGACSQAPSLNPQQFVPVVPYEPVGDNAGYGLALYSGGVYAVGVEYNRLYLRGSDNGYLRNYRADGLLLWSRTIGSTGSKNEAATSVAVDSRGHIYVAGWTEGQVGDSTNAGGCDGFLRKYDPQGNVLWTRQLGTPADDAIWKVTVDRFDNIYVAGLTSGTFPGQSRHAADNNPKLFLAKHLPSGVQSWLWQAYRKDVSTFDDYSTVGGLAVSSEGNLFVGGQQRVEFVNYPQGNYSTGYLHKFENDEWYGSSLNRVEVIGGIVADQKNNAYIVGSCRILDNWCNPYGGTVGESDLFVNKLSAEADWYSLMWGRNRLDQTSGDLRVTGVSMKYDVLFISGYTYGTIDPSYQNQGGADAFSMTLSFTDSGYLMNYLPTQPGSSGFDAATAAVGSSLDDFYVAGYTDGLLPGQSDRAGRDAFLRRSYIDGWSWARWLTQY